jgi:hypothetical protein
MSDAKFTHVVTPATDKKLRLYPNIAKRMNTATNPMKAPAAGVRKKALMDEMADSLSMAGVSTVLVLRFVAVMEAKSSVAADEVA